MSVDQPTMSSESPQSINTDKNNSQTPSKMCVWCGIELSHKNLIHITTNDFNLLIGLKYIEQWPVDFSSFVGKELRLCAECNDMYVVLKESVFALKKRLDSNSKTESSINLPRLPHKFDHKVHKYWQPRENEEEKKNNSSGLDDSDKPPKKDGECTPMMNGGRNIQVHVPESVNATFIVMDQSPKRDAPKAIRNHNGIVISENNRIIGKQSTSSSVLEKISSSSVLNSMNNQSGIIDSKVDASLTNVDPVHLTPHSENRQGRKRKRTPRKRQTDYPYHTDEESDAIMKFANENISYDTEETDVDYSSSTCASPIPQNFAFLKDNIKRETRSPNYIYYGDSRIPGFPDNIPSPATSDNTINSALEIQRHGDEAENEKSSIETSQKSGADQDGKYPCLLCSKVFEKKSNWKRHIVMFHEDHAFACRICGSIFAEKFSLQIHETHTHGVVIVNEELVPEPPKEEPPVASSSIDPFGRGRKKLQFCHTCHTHFTSKYDLKRHRVMTGHMGGAGGVCMDRMEEAASLAVNKSNIGMFINNLNTRQDSMTSILPPISPEPASAGFALEDEDTDLNEINIKKEPLDDD